MSSIIRARSALTGRWEGWEVIGGSSLELKVAGPSMLGIGCPDRHAFLFTPSMPPPKTHRPRRALSRESGFVHRRIAAIEPGGLNAYSCPFTDLGPIWAVGPNKATFAPTGFRRRLSKLRKGR